MAYVSLYRRYRPRTFAEVVGQAHVTRTLANAITEDRLSHAYLFTGPRGTGKTSTARILAAALNCEDGPTPTPCGTCEHCRSITEGSSVDVIELDMASHGGVDDARELRDRALFAPARARRKVYILDEVHMASTAAFNALLKLIEEPPGHVLFAMATTDPQKVLPTILSRVQRLDLRRVPAGEVAAHVRVICDAEGYTIEPDAVDAVVRAGDGSVRDTLSVLEQVLAYAGTDVTAAAVAQTLGTSPADRLFELLELLASRDLGGALALVQRLLDDGHDLRRFTLDLVQHARDLLVLQVAPDDPDLVDATDERRRQLLAQTTLLDQERLLRMVDVLAATVAEQRHGSPRLPLELALARLAVPGADGELSALADRLTALESGSPTRPGHATGAAGSAGATATDVRSPASAEVPAPSVGAGATPAVHQAPETPQTGQADRTAAAPAHAAAPSEAPAVPDAPISGDAAADENAPTDANAPADADAPADGGGSTDAEAPADGEVPADAAARADGEVPADAAAPADGEVPMDGEAIADGDAPEATTRAASAAAVTTPATDDDPLAVVTAHWQAVLELLKQSSRRHHAIFEPAVPISVRNRILTLRYAPRYASFHAVQARGGELSGALIAALERSCGLKLRIDVEVEGAPSDRRPLPPSVTPDDARTPVLDEQTPAAAGVGAGTEETDVREAELDRPARAVDVDELLQRELGAELLDDRPPPSAQE